MPVPKSRYTKARPFVASSAGVTAFPGQRPRDIATAEGVIEHQVKVGDRLDRLAQHYYNNDRLWWRIVDANPEFFYGQTHLPEGAATIDPSDPLVHSPGVALSPTMEGSVLLIPRQSGS